MEEQACSDMQAKTVMEKKVPNETAIGSGELKEAILRANISISNV